MDAAQDLLSRAQQLGDQTLGAVALRCGVAVPPDLRRAKGWVGELMERALGASAGSRPLPDFPELGIELKTLPVGANGLVRESTHVCTAPLREGLAQTWESSLVRRKLARVLWIPVQADPAVPLARRRIGRACLWSPSPAEEAVLREDWEEIMDLICMGGLGELSSELGVYLQIRPKAPDGGALTPATDEGGAPSLSLPRGFYLRPAFTNRLLDRDG